MLVAENVSDPGTVNNFLAWYRKAGIPRIVRNMQGWEKVGLWL